MRVYGAMTTHTRFTVDIDAPAVAALLEHAAVAVDAGIMTSGESCRWARAELDRFVTARG